MKSATYLIPLRNNEVLLSRRFNTGWMDGMYSLIAGHLDGDESVHNAMIREAFEEANIKVSIDGLEPATVIHRKSSDAEYVDFFFVVRKWKGNPEIVELHKCDDLSWFPLDELPKNLLPHVKEALDNYKNKISFSGSGW